MGKRIMNVLAFLAVLGGSVALTIITGRGSVSTMVYNFAFLAVMAVIYLVGMLLGMFRWTGSRRHCREEPRNWTGIFRTPGKVKNESLAYLKGIFDHRYLDEKMDSFVSSMENTQEGIGDIEEYINEDEIDLHVHKKLLEMAPDIFTSLGILGTFVGLVWGPEEF